MKSCKTLVTLSSIVLALAAPVTSQASAVFQGLTFTFIQTDSDSLTFGIKGTPTGDWATAGFLGAFSLNDLGLDFAGVGSATALANGPGAVNLAGSNGGVNGNAPACDGGSGNKFICFNITPDIALPSPIDFLYTIDFSQALNIDAAGPHLKIAFTETQGAAKKVGSLYSQNVGLGTSSTSSGGASSSGDIPEPNTGSMALLGLGLLAGSFAWRRHARRV
jgi:MYXO-CTERM domain-containing protein